MGKQNKPSANSTNEELHMAARSGDMKSVLSICSKDPLAVNYRDRHSRTPLHLAAWSGQVEIVNFLCKNKADIGAAAMDDMGAIHFAAQKGHLEVVRTLLTNGVSVKSVNRKGMTALHYAAQGSHHELVKYLVKKGSNLDAKNKAGNTPLDLASTEEIRVFLAESKTAPGKAVNGEEKSEKTEAESSLQEKVDGEGASRGDMEAKDEKEEVTKRKAEEGETKETQPEAKKTKVALSHLLAADDTQDEEENM